MHTFHRYETIIEDWPAFIEASHSPLPTALWHNPLKTTSDSLFEKMAIKGVELTPINWRSGAFRFREGKGVGASLEYLAGLYHVQEEIAMLPVVLLQPQPDETVFDMCAAPGNKTAQAAVMMQNKGTLIANEVNVGRMRPLRQMINRLGLTNVSVTNFDATRFPKQPAQFDKIIVDVHCSCEGTSRKNPDVLQTIEDQYSSKICASQTAVLIRALQLCKPGGTIVYSTCTYAPEENENVVQQALNAVESKITAKIRKIELTGLKWSSGLLNWEQQTFRKDMKNCLRIYPHQNDTGGFFVAVIDKLTDDRKAKVSEPVSFWDNVKVKPVEQDWLLGELTERFGIPVSVFDEFILFHTNKKYAAIIRKETMPITKPQPHMLGLPFIHINMKKPKPTTPGAMFLGKYASKNILNLNNEQTTGYLKGEVFTVALEQVEAFDGDGYVLVKNHDVFLGTAIIYVKGNRGEVHGQFPKAWQENATHLL